MAISSRIPLPGANNDAFKDVMDYFEQIQQRKAQQQQAAAQLAQQGKYQQGELGIRQQEANIAAKQFQDEHAKALLETDPQVFAKMFAGLGNMGSPGSAPGMSSSSMSPRSTTPGAPVPSAPGGATQGSMTPLQRMWMKKYMGLEETPDEKQQRAVETAGGSETAKLKAKKEQDYLDAGDLINKYSGNVETALNLLDKYRTQDKTLTGNIPGIQNKLHFGTEDQGIFNSATLPLLSPLVKDISQKGGAVVANLMAPAKPNMWNSMDTNWGNTQELINQMKVSYNNAKEGYEQSTGKPYPKKMPSVLKSFEPVNVKAPNGRIISMPRYGAVKLIKEHPDHEIME